MSDVPNNTPQEDAPEGRVRIVNSTGIGAGTRVLGLENAKIHTVEVLPFGPDDLITARLTLIDVELDLVAKDLAIEDDPEPRLPRLAPVEDDEQTDDVEVQAITRLRLRRGDVLVVTIPKDADPLTAQDHERVRQTFRNAGVTAPVLVLEGGLSLQILNQRDIALPPDVSSPGVSP